MNRTALFAILLALTALPAMAQEYAPITGAFGFELGQVVDEATLNYSHKSGLEPLGTVTYTVEPPTPSRFFSLYSLVVDLSTMRIVQIRAQSEDYSSETNIEADLNELIEALTNKYGPGKQPPELFDYELESKGKSIAATNFGNAFLLIHYKDDEAFRALNNAYFEKQKDNDQDAL